MAASYEISKAAAKDWRDIIRYTLNKFGKKQVQKYTDSLQKCLDDLANKKGQLKTIEVSEYEVLIKRCQKHYIFALNEPNQPLLIIAIFHERMDLIQRLKNRLG